MEIRNSISCKIKRKLLFCFARFYSDKEFLEKLFPLMMGYPLNLEYPRTFSEKMQWLKLYNRNQEYSRMVDKYEAKKYVSSIIGDQYIIPTIGIYNDVEEIDFENLPNQFVLKCTHNSGRGMYICKDKTQADVALIKKGLKNGLRQNYFLHNREWPYKNVKPRIIAEQYISDNDEDLKDYKFFCFNGDPLYCQVISGRNSNMTIDFYDRDWNHQSFHEPFFYPFSDKGHCRPSRFDEMLQLSKQLSLGIPFIRVDFYQVNNQVYFGELTFYPTSGMGGFDPEEWDNIFGNLINLKGLDIKEWK